MERSEKTTMLKTDKVAISRATLRKFLHLAETYYESIHNELCDHDEFCTCDREAYIREIIDEIDTTLKSKNVENTDINNILIKIIDNMHSTRATIDMADFHLLVGAALKAEEISLSKACELLGMHRDAVIAAYNLKDY